MIVDHRTYTVRPGSLRKYLKLYEEFGLPVQRRHLGEPFAYLTSDTGDVNSVVHLWLYESADDRMRRRAQLQSDPDWAAYLTKLGEFGYLERQETKLMIPASFAELPRPAQKSGERSDGTLPSA
jgi:hypothetical protein